MTIAEFLTAFAEAAPSVTWKLHPLGGIRVHTGSSSVCPLAFLANTCGGDAFFTTSTYDDARIALGLAHDDGADIAAAADERDTQYPEIRNALLAACGLAKEPM